ncbi:MAG: AAA family ATPase [Eubacteriaceae bacterium]|nr:AAA family ATPase [Eubacteriaceae bacterium]
MKNRILIIGSPGSGKSTFARALGKKLNIPVYHLDNLYWNADKTNVERDVFDRSLTEVLEKESWIIDGNYSRTMEMRLEKADTVFFLDLPVEVCLESVRNRIGTVRPDIPWVEEEEDAEFMEYIRNFPETHIPRMLSLFDKYPDKEYITFRTRDEADKFLNGLN